MGLFTYVTIEREFWPDDVRERLRGQPEHQWQTKDFIDPFCFRIAIRGDGSYECKDMIHPDGLLGDEHRSTKLDDPSYGSVYRGVVLATHTDEQGVESVLGGWVEYRLHLRDGKFAFDGVVCDGFTDRNRQTVSRMVNDVGLRFSRHVGKAHEHWPPYLRESKP